MKFGQILKMSVVLAVTYTIGEIAGKLKGFNQFVDQHEDVLFKDDEYVSYEIRKGCVIHRFKKKDSEEGDN